MNQPIITHPEHENSKKATWRNKVLSLLLLSILLIIPSLLIMQITTERQSRKDEAYKNIENMWGKPQSITGFYFRIPSTKGAIYLYPDSMNLHSKLHPETRKRGIYKVPVYKNNIDLHSRFMLSSTSPQWRNLNGEDLSKAELVLQIYDLSKGLDTDMDVMIDGHSHEGKPVLLDNQVYENEDQDSRTSSSKAFDEMVVDYPLNMEKLKKGIDIRSNFILNGTEFFKVIPNAIHNRIQMTGNWQDPSVVGDRLPNNPVDVKKGEFNTQWSFINRSISAVSTTSIHKLKKEALGVSLMILVDNYTKVERSLKYALMIIILCFAAMFMLEIFNKKELHIIHYALAGMSLVLFYILLLSISEYLGFNIAYLLSAIATIALLVWFVGGILHSRKLGLYLGAILSIAYTYNFILLNAKEYALLMGSIGLFMILYVIMYFTRKIDFN